MRIQKYLSQKRILSRRETEDCIRKGLIAVNGKIVRELGVQIDPAKDRVEILSAGRSESNKKITIAINKPKGIVSSKNKSEGITVFEFFPQFKNLNAVGRLDKDSEGLLLLSNDGVVTSAVTGTGHKIEKEYVVSVRGKISPGKIKKMENGIKLEEGITLPAKVRLLNPRTFIIILREGRKHQIRRMANALYLTITKLKRIRIGNIHLGDIAVGEFRPLTKIETEKLKKMAE
ncbi:MAG: pseudouridine synthase [Patescibacteria group bacterium]|nr:pseudouridine synthase [Patescibacteria group bacterium]